MPKKKITKPKRRSSILGSSPVKRRNRTKPVVRNEGVLHARKGWFTMAVGTAMEFTTEKRHEMHGFLYAALGLVLALSLIPARENLLGPVGTHLFRFAFGAFGLSAVLIPLGFGIWGISLMRGRELYTPSVKAGGWALIGLAGCLLADLIFDGAIERGPAQGLFMGGKLGESLGGFLQRSVASTGTVVISLVLCGMALYLLEKESLIKNAVLQVYERLRIGLKTGFTFWRREDGGDLPMLEKKNEDRIRIKRIAEAAAAKVKNSAVSDGDDRVSSMLAMAQADEDGNESDFVKDEEEDEEESQAGNGAINNARDRLVAAEAFLKKRHNIKISAVGPKINSAASSASISEVVEGRSDLKDYKLPPLSILKAGPGNETVAPKDYEDVSLNLEKVLLSFGVTAKVVEVCPGPAVTRYEIELAPGIKMNRVTNLADDIALGAKVNSVRIEGPIPGKGTLGVEIPNAKPAPVFLKDLASAEEFGPDRHKLIFAVGKDIGGSMIFANLAEMPHLLVAGATGAGKSVCLNSIISSILLRAAPDEVKFLMIDPKRVELTPYDGIPHLLRPVVTNPKQAAGALRITVEEMEERYKLLAMAGMRKIDDYNEFVDTLEDEKEFVEPMTEEELEEVPIEKPTYRRLPYIVVIVDELADLMMVSANEVESSIARLAQMARGVGIHLVLATQRPSVDVITGVIKANFPSRIAFQVSSKIDSRTILDGSGAEALLGKGDMLFSPYSVNKPIRVQNCFISGAEVNRIVRHVKEQADPVFDKRFEKINDGPAGAGAGSGGSQEDELYEEAVRQVIRAGQASTSKLQRFLGIGYGRAARLLDIMEEEGIIGPPNGTKAREILLNPDDYSEEEMSLTSAPKD